MVQWSLICESGDHNRQNNKGTFIWWAATLRVEFYIFESPVNSEKNIIDKVIKWIIKSKIEPL